MNFFKEYRKQEVLVLIYRLLLIFGFYQIVRFLFWFFNRNLIKIDGLSHYFLLAFHGTVFDTAGIFYVNALFILLSLLPLVINTRKSYQSFLFWLYFITNGLAYSMNFGDIIYYRFSQARLTNAALQVAEHEDNLLKVFFYSIIQNPLVLLSFIVLMALWVFLYKKVKIKPSAPGKLVPYFLWSFLTLAIATVLIIGGIRGDFKHSTRPITLIDANKYIKNPFQANVVLNSTFSFIRTINSNSFKEVHFMSEKEAENLIQPYKLYERPVKERPNIVIFIVESLSREYVGAFNTHKNIKNYISYTPFLDSLSSQGLIFPNSFSNGRQSIHAMGGILAGIPTMEDAFTGSPYSNQKIQSLVSICNSLGYDTSFYHGAPDGSMGFQGFAEILGYKHYYGKTEYNNDADFDGTWAIWDEPFLQYFAKTTGKTQPFMATVFTASSHHPFKIPEKYKGKFRKGPLEMNEPTQYTDDAIRKYFETAKKQPWFHNTIFVITGDHTNQIYYDEYKKSMNGFAVPIIFYSPNPDYHLKGENPEFAQQMDIYPTLVDLIGYHKPFRSWGVSLLSEKQYPHLIVNWNGSVQYIIGNYIYRFDGQEVKEIYAKDDLAFEHNLKGKIHTPEVQHGELLAKAYYQDYMYRIVQRKLD